jgi:hypothetical protein
MQLAHAKMHACFSTEMCFIFSGAAAQSAEQ